METKDSSLFVLKLLNSSYEEEVDDLVFETIDVADEFDSSEVSHNLHSFTLPLQNCSYIFVISLAQTICLFSCPYASHNSVMVRSILCGASKNTMVLCVDDISCNIVVLLFPEAGRNPLNKNSVDKKPQTDNAAVTADGPTYIRM